MGESTQPLKVTFGIKLNKKSRFINIKKCKNVLITSLKNLVMDFGNLKLLLK